MALKIDPGLLRACAAYLAHASTYRASALEGEALALLRRDARGVAADRGWSGPSCTPPDELTDAITQEHLDAITRFGITPRKGQAPGVQATARAILAATPRMVIWWCEELGEPLSQPAIERWLRKERAR